MSTFYGVRKVNGEWSDEEKEKVRRLWMAGEKKHVKKMKAAGFDLAKIAVPLPRLKNLKQYKKDVAVKKYLEPFQTMNPFRLRKPYVD